MNSTILRLKHFLGKECGATAVEYAALLVLIVVVCIAAVDAVGHNAFKEYDSVSAHGLDGKHVDNSHGKKRGKKRKK